MKPSSVSGIVVAIKEHNLTLIPSLVGRLNVREVERCGAIVGVWRYSGDSALVGFVDVRGVVVVQNVNGDKFRTLYPNRGALESRREGPFSRGAISSGTCS